MVLDYFVQKLFAGVVLPQVFQSIVFENVVVVALLVVVGSISGSQGNFLRNFTELVIEGAFVQIDCDLSFAICNASVQILVTFDIKNRSADVGASAARNIPCTSTCISNSSLIALSIAGVFVSNSIHSTYSFNFKILFTRLTFSKIPGGEIYAGQSNHSTDFHYFIKQF